MWWFAERNGARSNPSRATVKRKPLHFGAVFFMLQKTKQYVVVRRAQRRTQ